MARFAFGVGVEISIDEVPYKIAATIPGGWQLVRQTDYQLSNKSRSELLGLYEQKRLKRLADLSHLSERERASRLRKRKIDLADLPPRRRRRVQIARTYIREVAVRTYKGGKCDQVPTDAIQAPSVSAVTSREAQIEGLKKKEMRLKAILRQISKEEKLPLISKTTYYRWVLLYGEGEVRDLNPDWEARGRRNQLGSKIQSFFNIAIEEVLQLKPGCGAGAIEVQERVYALIDAENEFLPQGKKLEKPSPRTCYVRWNEVPEYERAVLKYGRARADNIYRAIKGHAPVKHCLDLVEYDECDPLPILVADEESGAILGKPNLAWFLDVYSQYPVGMYVGFEPPSDMVLVSALRHAVLPKTYIKTEYPAIKGEWLAAGLLHHVVFDNGMSQHAETIEVLADELEFGFSFARRRTPGFKPFVENSFRRIRDALRAAPGYVPPIDLKISSYDYDPRTDAALGYRQFLYALHMLIVDVWGQSRHPKLRLTPNERWSEGTKIYEPEFLDDPIRLDSIFSIVREGRALDNRGVINEGLWYRSDELENFFRRRARECKGRASTKVKIRLNPSDISKIEVYDRDLKAWLPCPAEFSQRDYAVGLSLHQHRLIRKWSREKYKSDDISTYVRARRDLAALLFATLTPGQAMRTTDMVARALNIGSQAFFGSIDLAGNMGPATGPFTGYPMNPFEERVIPITHEPKPPPQGPGVSANAASSQSDANGQSRRIRVPTFNTDNSLTGSGNQARK